MVYRVLSLLYAHMKASSRQSAKQILQFVNESNIWVYAFQLFPRDIVFASMKFYRNLSIKYFLINYICGVVCYYVSGNLGH